MGAKQEHVPPPTLEERVSVLEDRAAGDSLAALVWKADATRARTREIVERLRDMSTDHYRPLPYVSDAGLDELADWLEREYLEDEA